MEITIDDMVETVAEALAAKNAPHKEWEEYTPIQVDDETKTIDAYLLDGIHVPGVYARLCHLIRTSDGDYTINLHINNGGGLESSATMIMDAIKQSKAVVVAHLSGLVASAATLITMACDKIEVADHLMFMIHESSFDSVGGKFSDMKTFQSFYDDHTKAMSKAVYGGFITDDEIEEMHRGKELWYGSQEVLDRWELKNQEV